MTTKHIDSPLNGRAAAWPGASLVGTLAITALSFLQQAHAQDFPSRPIQMVVPYAAGGSTDAMARSVAQKMGDVLGQAVVIDNRPGAGTLIGTRRVRMVAPDGYTILLTTTSMALNAFAYKNPGYKMSDFVSLGPVGTNPFLLITHNSVPATNVQQLVAHSKAHPDALNNASIGASTVTGICYERFKHATGFKAVNVNYGGGAPATQAVVAGTVQVNMAGIDAVPLAASPNVRILAVSTEERWPTLPNVPTFKEQGYPQVGCISWVAAFAPAGTPAAVLAKLRQGFAAAMNDSGVRDRIKKVGLDLWTGKPESFDAFLKADTQKWQEDIQRIGLSLE